MVDGNGTEMGVGRLGLVVEGSLVDGLKARLDGGASVEAMRVGQFVRIQGEQHDFFCLVTDVQLGTTDPRVLQDPPDADQDFLRQVLAGTAAYGAIKVQPMLMLARDALPGEDIGRPQPVRTVPEHFSRVYEADEGDFERVFGAEGVARKAYFQIGRPLDMEVPVCLDLRRFVERSNGVFGKSGTGKSFLTRLLLCGVIRHSIAVNLIFDMHSEYAFGSRSEDGHVVKGLQHLFGKRKVMVYALDADSDASRRQRADGAISIGLNEIEVEDIALLQEELRLNPTAVETANLLVDELGPGWIRRLLDLDADGLKNLAATSGAHPGALAALKRKLREIERLEFVKDEVRDSSVRQMVEWLKQGRHVVLEFGRFGGLLPYMLVANVITRRIHQEWSELSERSLHSGGGEPAPPQLMITIEEAHRFLNSRAASQTIFGTIAREMRKFQVTLLVVDQRPSGIDDEVLSQIGTRITCQLNDDRDIEAVFSGVSGASHLRSALASLESREQAIVLGHAVPMPVVIRSRPYDETFYRAVTSGWSEAGLEVWRQAWSGEPDPPAGEEVSREARYRQIFGDDDAD